MFGKKEEKSADTFWQEYEEKTGEKVLGRGLGKYVCGWQEFDDNKWGGIWGLIITTSGGFRFHHFPQNSWIDAFTTMFTQGMEKPKEKKIFISNEKIISSEPAIEKKWWKKVFSPSPPHFIVYYLDEEGLERKLVFEAEYSCK